MAKSSLKIRQSLSTISSKDFLLQWRSSNARCLSWSRCFFIRVLKKKEPRVTFTANGKRKFVPRDQVSPLLVVYCFLYLLKYRALGCVSSLKSQIALKIRIWILVKKHTLRFFDEDDYEYEIFSILSVAQAWTSVILAGKRDNGRHSTTSFSEEVVVAGRSYQVIKWRLPFAVNVILNLSNNYSWRSIERIPKRSRNSIHNWSMVRTEFWMENSGLFPYFF